MKDAELVEMKDLLVSMTAASLVAMKVDLKVYSMAVLMEVKWAEEMVVQKAYSMV
jgi:hypothetical protein